MTTAVVGIDEVATAHSDPALAALQRDLPAALTNARFDRNELTLTITR